VKPANRHRRKSLADRERRLSQASATQHCVGSTSIKPLWLRGSASTQRCNVETRFMYPCHSTAITAVDSTGRAVLPHLLSSSLEEIVRHLSDVKTTYRDQDHPPKAARLASARSTTVRGSKRRCSSAPRPNMASPLRVWRVPFFYFRLCSRRMRPTHSSFSSHTYSQGQRFRFRSSPSMWTR
jgi:hypothetical protein